MGWLHEIQRMVRTSLISGLRERQNSSCKYHEGSFETPGTPSKGRYRVVVLGIPWLPSLLLGFSRELQLLHLEGANDNDRGYPRICRCLEPVSSI
jgi:hypothetical protein